MYKISPSSKRFRERSPPPPPPHCGMPSATYSAPQECSKYLANAGYVPLNRNLLQCYALTGFSFQHTDGCTDSAQDVRVIPRTCSSFLSAAREPGEPQQLHERRVWLTSPAAERQDQLFNCCVGMAVEPAQINLADRAVRHRRADAGRAPPHCGMPAQGCARRGVGGVLCGSAGTE
jgi:hypothetical protein